MMVGFSLHTRMWPFTTAINTFAMVTSHHTNYFFTSENDPNNYFLSVRMSPFTLPSKLTFDFL